MTVYIEYVIIDNMVMDAIIIYLTMRFMRLKVKAVRIGLCSALGTALAILVSLLSLSAYIMLPIKIASGLIIVALISKYSSAWQFLKTFAAFMAITLVLGGACFMALFLATESIEQAIVLGYEKIPIGAIVLPIALAALLASHIIKQAKRLRYTQPFYYKVELEVDGEHFTCTGYLDSGNMLYDVVGNPIIVADKNLFKNLATRKLISGGRLGSIPIATATGMGSMKTCSTDKLVIYSESTVNIIYNITVGLAERDFEGFSCLLHPAVV